LQNEAKIIFSSFSFNEKRKFGAKRGKQLVDLFHKKLQKLSEETIVSLGLLRCKFFVGYTSAP
jgi:hypothetical protein